MIKLFRLAILFSFLLCNAQDEEVIVRVRWTGTRILTYDAVDAAFDNTNEFVMKTWFNGGDQKTEELAINPGAYALMVSGVWYGLNREYEYKSYRNSGFTLSYGGYEEDCDDERTYNDCDSDFSEDYKFFPFRNSSSGRDTTIIVQTGPYYFRFELNWYPAPFTSDYSQHQFNQSPLDPDPDLNQIANARWSVAPPTANPTLSDDNIQRNICQPFQRTLTSPKPACISNGVLIFYEYQNPTTLAWHQFDESPSYNQSITVDLSKSFYDEIKRNNTLLHEDLNIRIYRKTLNGVLINNTPPASYTYTRFSWGGMFGTEEYRMTRNYQQNISVYLGQLYPPPPAYSPSDTIYGAPPICNLESNASLLLEYDSIQGNAFGHYQISLHKCFSFPLNCPIGKGSKLVDDGTFSSMTPFTQLETGLYRLTITDVENVATAPDQLGCSNTYPVIIPNKPPIQVTVSDTVYTNTNVRCFDTSDGIATLSITGGNPPYIATEDSVYGPWEAVSGSTHRMYNLAPGKHTFYAGDSEDCPVAFVYDTLSKPDTLRLFLQIKKQYITDTIEPGERHVSCYHLSNGEYTVQARQDSGLVNPLFHFWISGTNTRGQSYLSDTLTESSTNQSSGFLANPLSTFTDLSAGFYTIHLKDNNDCYFTDTFSLREPTPLTLTGIDSLENQCAKGQLGMLKVLAGGATHPYRYYKDSYDPYPASTWRVCTSDNFRRGECQGNLHQTAITYNDTAYYSNLPSNLPGLTHVAYVRDANNCITPLNFTVTEPPSVLPDVIVKKVVCKGEASGELHASATGGVPPYRFEWNNGGPTLDTNFVMDSLRQGDYYLDIRDSNGCLYSSGPYDVQESEFLLTATATIHAPISCAEKENAVIRVKALGGGESLQYSLNGINWQTSFDFERLAAGKYTVQVKDNLGCHIVLPEIEILKPNVLTATLINSPSVSCFGLSDATIQLELSGGTPDYFQNISGTWTKINSPLILTGRGAGINYIELKDSHNCQLTKEVEVASPSQIEIVTSIRTNANINQSDGSVTIVASGAVSPYTYVWPDTTDGPNSGSSTLINHPAGVYQVTISDHNGCDTIYYAGINNIGGPTENNSATQIVKPLCHNSNDGSISVVYTGINPISYEWIPSGITSSSLTQIGKGEYLLKVTSGNGAITTAPYTLLAPSELIVQSSTSTLLCHNACNAAIRLMVDGGTGPYNVLWNTGESGATLQPICAGDYNYTVNDANNCEEIGDVSILNPLPVEVDLGPDKTLCQGQYTQFDAGHSGSSFVWNTGELSQVISTTVEGQYIATVTTPDGCMGADTVNVVVSNNLLAGMYYISTKIYAGTTLVFVDNTLPVPDFVEWNFGDSAVVINDDNMFLPQVLFPYPGTFYVDMIAHLGECKDTVHKAVKVFALEDSTGFKNGRYVSGIESMTVFPNPAQFSIKAQLKLYEQDQVILHLVDGYGNVVREEILNGTDHYEQNIDLSTLTRGIYVLRALCGNSQKSIIVTLN